jgi:SprT-like family.
VHVYVANWKRKLGNCKYGRRIEPDEYGQRLPNNALTHAHGHYAIGVAQRTFEDGDTWDDTLRHELAHATAYVKNGMMSCGHGGLWQQEAKRLGTDPTRTGHVQEKNVPDYYLGCTRCGMTWDRHSRSKTIQYPDRYRCGKCGDSRLVSWEQGDEMPTEPGTCAVDCEDLQ